MNSALDMLECMEANNKDLLAPKYIAVEYKHTRIEGNMYYKMLAVCLETADVYVGYLPGEQWPIKGLRFTVEQVMGKYNGHIASADDMMQSRIWYLRLAGKLQKAGIDKGDIIEIVKYCDNMGYSSEFWGTDNEELLGNLVHICVIDKAYCKDFLASCKLGSGIMKYGSLFIRIKDMNTTI